MLRIYIDATKHRKTQKFAFVVFRKIASYRTYHCVRARVTISFDNVPSIEYGLLWRVHSLGKIPAAGDYPPVTSCLQNRCTVYVIESIF